MNLRERERAGSPGGPFGSEWRHAELCLSWLRARSAALCRRPQRELTAKRTRLPGRAIFQATSKSRSLVYNENKTQSIFAAIRPAEQFAAAPQYIRHRLHDSDAEALGDSARESGRRIETPASRRVVRPLRCNANPHGGRQREFEHPSESDPGESRLRSDHHSRRTGSYGRLA